MELRVSHHWKSDEVEVGDILVIDSLPYIVRLDHGVGATDALLIGLSGQKDDYYAYFNLEALRNNLSGFGKVRHYKSSEYELRLFKK